MVFYKLDGETRVSSNRMIEKKINDYTFGNGEKKPSHQTLDRYFGIYKEKKMCSFCFERGHWKNECQ